MGQALGRVFRKNSCWSKQETRAEFLAAMKDQPLTYMGEVTDSNTLSVWDGDDLIIESDLEEMVMAWKGSLDMTGGVQ